MASTELLKSAALDGIPANSDTLLLAAWIKVPADTAGGFVFLRGYDAAHSNHDGPYLAVDWDSATPTVSGWTAYGKNGATQSFFADSVDITGPDLSDGWHSVIMSIKISTATMQVALDRTCYDLSDDVTWTNTDPVILDTCNTWKIGDGSGVGATFFYMDDLFVAFDEPFLDLTDPANINGFFSADNRRISWGADGSIPVSSQPVVYLHGNSSNYTTNHGYGGNFALAGGTTALSTVSGPPVEP